MPRAHRHFLAGYVWHITPLWSRQFQSFQWFQWLISRRFNVQVESRWSEAIAVGSLPFVETVKNDRGIKAMHREVLETDETYALREPAKAYARKLTGRNEALSSENTLPWNESLENPGT
jgi:hypothetical protein